MLRSAQNAASTSCSELSTADVPDNIASGRHQATDAQIDDAADRANTHDFIIRLSDPYETFVGEHGVRLSGSQQQP
jgi:ATP-binding cassette subfamily B protein